MIGNAQFVSVPAALLAGLVTIAAPCILPVLPILLGAAVGQKSKLRPLFITLGFITMFTLAELFLAGITLRLHVRDDVLRLITIGLFAVFGIFMIWPHPFEVLTQYLNKYINRANQIGSQAGTGNFGGFVLGMMLGAIWAPCAGPTFGIITALIASSKDLIASGILVFAYAVGAGIPMLLIAYGGQYATTQVRWIASYSTRIQQVFGVLILLLAVAMWFNYDTLLVTHLLNVFPSLTPKM